VAAASPKVTALRIIRRALRQCGAGRRRRRRCTQQEPCWARGWLTLARPPPSRPSGRCRIKVGRVGLLDSHERSIDDDRFLGFVARETGETEPRSSAIGSFRERVSLIDQYFAYAMGRPANRGLGGVRNCANAGAMKRRRDERAQIGSRREAYRVHPLIRFARWYK